MNKEYISKSINRLIFGFQASLQCISKLYECKFTEGAILASSIVIKTFRKCLQDQGVDLKGRLLSHKG